MDKRKHLTNASIARIALAKEGGDNILALEEFVRGSGDFVDEFGLDAWDNKVKPQIEHITRSLFEAV